jgi:hypothetical protein
MLFPTLRLLLEVNRDGGWDPIKIFCEYKDVHCLLKKLPDLAKVYKVDTSQVRVKNLATHEAICDAKLAIDKAEIKRRKNQRGEK